jgi:hypothetical protein
MLYNNNINCIENRVNLFENFVFQQGSKDTDVSIMHVPVRHHLKVVDL